MFNDFIHFDQSRDFADASTFRARNVLDDPPMTGDDVIILQNLLNRAPFSPHLGRWGIQSAVQKAVSQLQSSTSELENTDILTQSQLSIV